MQFQYHDISVNSNNKVLEQYFKKQKADITSVFLKKNKQKQKTKKHFED